MNYIFVLDIGTRFVRGIIFAKQEEDLVIVDVEVLEQEERAMLAGQIHDIEKVSRVVRNIKTALEGRNNILLKKVCCAVAGRNLLTQEGFYSVDRPLITQPIDEKEIQQLEFLAVESALKKVSSNIKDYYCVGYTVSEYILDGESIKNLLHHRGKNVQIKVLVTLLPYKVLESLFCVVENCGLEIEYLTLEPIASLEATISRDMYKMKLVLVDIGAGTSDIAVVCEGKVVNFGMIPYAGDNITEGFCKELLLEFKDAEKLKRILGNRGLPLETELSYIDIFGRTYQKKVYELLEILKPYVKELAEKIAYEVKRMIEDIDAIILVGGGSLTPLIEENISAIFGIEKNRIGIYCGKIGKILKLDDHTLKYNNPSFATAIGIGCLAVKQIGLSLLHIKVNGENFTLVNIRNKEINVLSALLSCGYTSEEIYGKVGLARIFSLNGEQKIIKGSLPKPAVIKVNNEAAELNTLIKEGDEIEFIKAENGKDAKPKIKDFIQFDKKTVKFNGQEIYLPIKVFIDSRAATFEDEIPDGSEVRIEYPLFVDDLLLWLGYGIDNLEDKSIKVFINHEEVTSSPKKCYELFIDDKEYKIEDIIDKKIEIDSVKEIIFKKIEPIWYIREFVNDLPRGKDLKVMINGEEYIFYGQEGKVFKNGMLASLDTVVNYGDKIITLKGKDAECILVDVFKYINVDLQNSMGRKIKLTVDGKEASFSTPLHDNANVDIIFE